MATIRPFRGLRFSESAGPLGSLVAPPYDVLSPAERDLLASKSEHNIVHLTLPEQNADDRSKFIKYARAASRLADWRRTGAVQLEEQPSFYRYSQVFNVPIAGHQLTRQSLIATIKVEPYEKGVVLPHEQTFPKHKEDRLRILEATRSHLECIYGLYEDDDKAVLNLIGSARGKVIQNVTTEDGVRHVVERIDDPDATCLISDAMKAKKVWIADGHHRYETACTFREQLGERHTEVAEDYMMMALSSISDPGLVLLPTHRMLKSCPIGPEPMREKLSGLFQISEAPNSELMDRIEAISEKGKRAFGVALPGGSGWILTLDDASKAGALVPGNGSKRLKELDVTILHEIIFGQILGLTGHDFFDYTRDPDEAVAAVEAGSPAAFLMNPPTVDDMRHIALGGEKMPQKSTYYYPKILSGLVVWSLGDF